MAFAASVIGALRRFLPDFLREHPVVGRARRRAVWALTHCRTSAMGGHVHACEKCGTSHFAFHSCNHRSCPQCGKQDTADWVERELAKRIGAPYFMVTFTLPEELRGLFFTPASKQIYEAFFAAASQALSACLANPRWLGATTCGFTMILHTWNQRLHFHPHIHTIVPGAGLDEAGRVVSVKSPGFLVPQPVLRTAFRRLFREKLNTLRQLPENTSLPAVDPSVWEKDWGVHLQPFGDGKRIIQYLGTYVCRTAISDARMLDVSESTVTFSWKDRARGSAKRKETISGVEFVSRYLRHVLPSGMRAIRRYGYCHPAAKTKRERIAFHTGVTLLLGPDDAPEPKPAPLCPCCKKEMISIVRLLALWKLGRDPPQNSLCPV
ncbi:MAG: transposase [Terrimicrobiaceae bacterium]